MCKAIASFFRNWNRIFYRQLPLYYFVWMGQHFQAGSAIADSEGKDEKPGLLPVFPYDIMSPIGAQHMSCISLSEASL